VTVDPGQLEQILVNLAVNGRDAMPDGGTLTIETANVELGAEYSVGHPGIEPGPFVMLAVSDTGHGMSDDVKDRLFEPFFTTKPMGRGTGLGLATIFGAVRQANGSIDVSSEPDRGSVFRIYLPRALTPAGALTTRRQPDALPTGDETVLLVEDDASVRELALLILRRLGYVVLLAANGGEALMLAEKHRSAIDLLLTDVVMPGLNGRELAERLVEVHPEMRVLFSSGYTDDIILHHGVVDERVDFISKPFTMQSLATKVRAALDRD
jgi:CheY-like chemotaxis protein